jgi:NADH-quinone oxidoreductase subunit N
MLVGFGFKVTAAPFHFWSPDVYQGSPTNVTTFMSVATKVAAFAALIRIFSGVFTATFDKWDNYIIFISILSMVLGNVAALTQTSVKRMLAYSGIAQAGYILIGVAVNNQAMGATASLFYLAAYATMNLGAFAVITVMAGRGEDIDDYSGLRGLYYRRPYVASAMALFLFSLGGFPPTVGFFAKFFVFRAAIDNGQVSLAMWGIATSAVSVYYYLRVAALMFTRPRDGETSYEWSRSGVLGGTVILVTAAGVVALGVLTNVLYDVSTQAASSLANLVGPHT